MCAERVLLLLLMYPSCYTHGHAHRLGQRRRHRHTYTNTDDTELLGRLQVVGIRHPCMCAAPPDVRRTTCCAFVGTAHARSVSHFRLRLRHLRRLRQQLFRPSATPCRATQAHLHRACRAWTPCRACAAECVSGKTNTARRPSGPVRDGGLSNAPSRVCGRVSPGVRMDVFKDILSVLFHDLVCACSGCVCV